jgi:hypothetical protein
MSYAVKYQGTFYDRHDQQWMVQILLDGHGGDATTIDIIDCNFYWKGSDFKYEPILTSSLEVTLVQSSNYQWREFLVTDESDYIVRLKRYDGSNWNTSPIWWTGYLLPDVITESYTSPNTAFTIRASDGLARLKNLYYSSTPDTRRSGFLSGVTDLGTILCRCLAELRTDLGSSVYTVNKVIDWLNTYENSHTSADSTGRLSPLDQTEVDQGSFTVYTTNDKLSIPMYEVVENICKIFGARLFLAYDETEEEICWHIITVNDFDGTSVNRSVHEVYDGTNYFDLLSQGTVTPLEEITTSNTSPTDTIFFLNANHEVEVIPAHKEILTGWKPKNQSDQRANNIIPSGEFEYFSNSNLSDWNSSTSLKDWTASAAPNSYERVKHPYQTNSLPDFPNRYGVQMNSNSMTLTSAQRTITDGFSGNNLLAIRIRAYYVAEFYSPTITGPFNGILETPRLPIDIRIVDGGTTRYLYIPTNGGFTWKTSPPTGSEIIYIELGGSVYDYKVLPSGIDFATYPESVQEFYCLIPVPTLTGGDGELEIEIKQCENPDDSNNNTRSILDGVIPRDETVFAVYEFVRANLLNEDGEWGNDLIKYVNNNANIKTTNRPIEVETIIGDAVDGEGLNVGTLKDTSGSPTSLWQWNGSVGGTDGYTIHRLLGQLMMNNYGGTTIKLSGDFNTGNKVYPYNSFVLSDNSTEKNMFLGDIKWNIPDDVATCMFLENRNTSATLTVDELHSEGEIGVTSPSGGNLSTYVPPAIDPNLDAG